MQAADDKKPAIADRGILGVLLTAFIFLTISALGLITGFLVWHHDATAPRTEIKPLKLMSEDLFIVTGEGRKGHGTVKLNKLATDKTARISSRRLRIEAEDYPFLEYTIDGRQPGVRNVFYWITADEPKKVKYAALDWAGDGPKSYRLADETDWSGSIIEVGLSFFGDLRGRPIEIKRLVLAPPSILGFLSVVWSEWNVFEGWGFYSSNYILGGASRPTISPVIAAAAWCGLAILLYSLWIFLKYHCPPHKYAILHRGATVKVQASGQGRGRSPGLEPGKGCKQDTAASPKRGREYSWDIRAAAAMFLIAWLALDARWQVNLWRQLQDTRYQYAGKSWQEKHLAERDGVLFAYAERLKKDIFGSEKIARIFLLRDTWRDYQRLRAMYHLLPHNIYNYGKYPQKKYIRDGDYILVLGKIKGLNYESKDGALHWGRKGVLKVERIDQDPQGSLYRFTAGE